MTVRSLIVLPQDRLLLRKIVLWVALSNLAYFGVEFAVAAKIGSVFRKGHQISPLRFKMFWLGGAHRRLPEHLTHP